MTKVEFLKKLGHKIRILRDENLESSIKGIYPCGEGAGYAGGIMTAGIDGLKCAIKVLENR